MVVPSTRLRTRIIGDYWIARDFGTAPKVKEHFYSSAKEHTSTEVYCCGTDKFEPFSLDNDVKMSHKDMVHPYKKVEFEHDPHNKAFTESIFFVDFNPGSKKRNININIF